MQPIDHCVHAATSGRTAKDTKKKKTTKGGHKSFKSIATDAQPLPRSSAKSKGKRALSLKWLFRGTGYHPDDEGQHTSSTKQKWLERIREKQKRLKEALILWHEHRGATGKGEAPADVDTAAITSSLAMLCVGTHSASDDAEMEALCKKLDTLIVNVEGASA